MMNRSVVYAVLFNIASVLLYILTVLFILDGTGWMPEAVSFSLGSVCLVIGILCSRRPSKKDSGSDTDGINPHI
ncbi:MAG: hypothetical protein ACI3XM_07020 [Eubacteriales bacterium]